MPSMKGLYSLECDSRAAQRSFESIYYGVHTSVTLSYLLDSVLLIHFILLPDPCNTPKCRRSLIPTRTRKQFSRVLLMEFEPELDWVSEGNSITAVILPCISSRNTCSLYSNIAYFRRSTGLQIQHNTASWPYYHPVLKWSF